MRENSRVRPAAIVATIALSAGAPLALTGCGGGGDTTDAAPPTATAPATKTEPTTEPAPTTETEPPPTTTSTTPAEPAPTTVSIRVSGGKLVGGIRRVSVSKGDAVVLVVRSDVADEIHLHGYDLSKDVAAGGTARLRFDATIPGRFEVELEARGQQLAEITVTP